MTKRILIAVMLAVSFAVATSAGKLVRSVCRNCNGKGCVVINKHCPSCGGSGTMQSRCGAGCRLIDYTSMLGPTPIYTGEPNTFYGFNVNQPCSNCGASGYVRTACSRCRGVGIFRTQVRCNNCAGNGEVIVDIDSVMLQQSHSAPQSSGYSTPPASGQNDNYMQGIDQGLQGILGPKLYNDVFGGSR